MSLVQTVHSFLSGGPGADRVTNFFTWGTPATGYGTAIATAMTPGPDSATSATWIGLGTTVVFGLIASLRTWLGNAAERQRLQREVELKRIESEEKIRLRELEVREHDMRLAQEREMRELALREQVAGTERLNSRVNAALQGVPEVSPDVVLDPEPAPGADA